MSLQVIPAPDFPNNGLQLRPDTNIWRARNSPRLARKLVVVRGMGKVTRRRRAGEAHPRGKTAIEVVVRGERLRIARGVDEATLHSLLLEMRSDGDARIEIALPGGERVRIARGVDAAELHSLLAMLPQPVE